MPRIFSLASVFILLASNPSHHLAGQPPAVVPTEKTAVRQPSLLELGKLYQALELPLPPKDAFFAVTGCFNQPRSYGLANEEFHYQFHFATGGPYPQANYQVWQGFRDYPGRKLEVVFPRPPRPESVLRFLRLDALRGPGHREGEGYGDLIFAVQCHLLQHFELARFFYGRCEKRLKEPFQRSLVLLAWNYWADELANPKRDRVEVAKNLRKLVVKHGFFEALIAAGGEDEENRREDVKRHQELLDRLELTMKPVRAIPGSIRAMIEELLEDPSAHDTKNAWFSADGTEYDELLFQKVGKSPARERSPDPYSKLSNLGFAAIPQLIEHVDDQRLVREPLMPFALPNGGPSGVVTLESRDFYPLGQKVRYILSAFFDLDQEKATKADYLNSWNELKLMTESDFIQKKINNIQEINSGLTEFICAKYKPLSLKLYDEILSRNINFKHFDDLVESLCSSGIPKSTKIEQLLRGAHSAYVNQSIEALRELLKLDGAAFSRACVAQLEKLVWDGNGGHEDWIRTHLVSLAFRTTDRKARESIEKYVKGLPANQRLAVLKELEFDSNFGPVRLEALSFLCQFLGDISKYQDPKEEKKGFKNLDHYISEIEIRNFAALQILKNIGVEQGVTDETSESEWEKIREFAKDEVDRRLKEKSRQ